MPGNEREVHPVTQPQDAEVGRQIILRTGVGLGWMLRPGALWRRKQLPSDLHLCSREFGVPVGVDKSERTLRAIRRLAEAQQS